MAWARAPRLRHGTPVRLHIAAVDLGRLSNPALVGKRSKDQDYTPRLIHLFQRL